MPPDTARWLAPDWPDLPQVRALMSTRTSGGPGLPGDFDVGREGRPACRAWLEQRLGAPVRWLHQVHGAAVVRVDQLPADGDAPQADAAVSLTPGVPAAVRVGDCLPVLFATDDGRAVAAAHAGWRGLAAGVLEATAQQLCAAAGCGPAQVRAWLGACIGPDAFEVGADVLQAFGHDPDGAPSPRFRRADRADGDRRWRADLPALARDRLRASGLVRIDGVDACTVTDASAFFSFRRDRSPGRMAAAIVRLA